MAKIMVPGGTKDIEVGTCVAIMVEDKDDVGPPAPPPTSPSAFGLEHTDRTELISDTAAFAVFKGRKAEGAAAAVRQQGI